MGKTPYSRDLFSKYGLVLLDTLFQRPVLYFNLLLSRDMISLVYDPCPALVLEIVVD